MAIRMQILVILLNIFILGKAQITGYEGDLIHGNETTIYCNYSSSKPPGASVWYLADKQYTSLCSVTENDGTLRENPDCFGEMTSPDASFAFYLLLDFNRDRGMEWNCAIGGNPVYLNLDILVIGTRVTMHSDEESTDIGSTFTMTANTECYYPPPQVIWCYKAGTGAEMCSDTDKYWEDAFQDEPVISNKPKDCPEFDDPAVQYIISTFTGKGERVLDITLYVKVGGVSYEDNRLPFRFTEGGLSAGAIAGIVIVVLVIIGGVVAGVGFGIKKFKK